MNPHVNLLPGAVAEILVSAAQKGAITLTDRYGIMAALLDESIDEDEIRALNRLLRSVIRGKIKVENELSVS